MTDFLVCSGIRLTSKALFKLANSCQRLQQARVEEELVQGRELDIFRSLLPQQQPRTCELKTGLQYGRGRLLVQQELENGTKTL
jgi:hypothetical protein